MAAFAESARGISPRAAHRSGRDTLASSGSCHRLKAAAFRQDMRLIRFPVDPISTAMTHPLRSTSITSLQHYYEVVRPCSNASLLSASRISRLYLFAYHRRTGSQVPYESPNENHASYTPDTAWPVGRISAMLFPEQGEGSGFGVTEGFSMLHQRFACARLSHPYLTQSKPRLFDHDVHHRGIWPKQLMAVWSLLLQGDSEGPSFISRTA